MCLKLCNSSPKENSTLHARTRESSTLRIFMVKEPNFRMNKGKSDGEFPVLVFELRRYCCPTAEDTIQRPVSRGLRNKLVGRSQYFLVAFANAPGQLLLAK